MKLALTLVLMLLLALLATTALAQELDFSGMSADEMRRDAADRVDGMESVLETVVALRDTTEREEQDLTKLRCINDKLAAIQGYLRLSEESAQSLDRAISAGDQDVIQHQYSLVVIASQRVRNLNQEATQCAGEVLTFAGDTEQSTTIDPDIPDEDLTEAEDALTPLSGLSSGEPLTESTPFQ
jgi:hypothetical protein